MHSSLREQYTKSIGLAAFGFYPYSTRALMHCDNKSRQIGVNYDYDMLFSNSPRECWYYSLNIQIWFSKRWASRMLFHVVPLKDGNCRLTMPVQGRCTSDALTHTFDIGVFSLLKEIYQIKNIHNQYANVTEIFGVAFDANDC